MSGPPSKADPPRAGSRRADLLTRALVVTKGTMMIIKGIKKMIREKDIIGTQVTKITLTNKNCTLVPH